MPKSSRSSKNSVSLSPEKASGIYEEKERKAPSGYKPDISCSSTKPASRSTSKRPSASSIGSTSSEQQSSKNESILLKL